MRRILSTALATVTLAALQPSAIAQEAPNAPVATEATAPLDALVSQVAIPYEKFELDNGLTTIVHTDRKAPIVGVTIYYRVGSKHEPRGRTGFAHLYEHLFFGGSANAPNFDVPLEAAGSTTTNGSTWYDRTNYVVTIPTGALELALFLESDRMGYLLPAVTQDKLDKQRGVVQNEKRQGDNQPYGLVDYVTGDGLFPVGHPYRHSTIGSMADLEAATLVDVRNWFRENYGPNNVVMVMSGDIDAATARPLVEKWFGDLEPGPEVPQAEAGPVTLDAPVTRTMVDQVPVTRLHRVWSGPGLNAADSPALMIGMHILGGLASSRLDNALVRGDQLAVAVRASAQVFEQVSFLNAEMDVKPGVDRAAAEKRFDEVIARYRAEGPTEDEVRRAVTSVVSAQIGALEKVGGFYGKGATLAEGEMYSGDPQKFAKDLAAMASLTPADVRTALDTWLSRPVFALDVVPGERTEDGALMGGWGDEASRPAPEPDARKPAPPLPAAPERHPPEVSPVADLVFPEIERAKLSNGIGVALARRTAVPKVMLSLAFDGGYAADAYDTPGTQGLMLEMLDEGTEGMNATEIAEAQERLGAAISATGSLDESVVTMSALTANLGPSLDLMARIVRRPAFAPSEVARLKDQRLAQLSQVLASPPSLASREFGKLVFEGHPYGQPSDGLGTQESLSALTPADLQAAHDKWLRPDLATITVVGDVTMAQLLPLLERHFGNWQVPAAPAPRIDLAAATPPASPRIVLIDRPNSPQSVIYAGRVLPLSGTQGGVEALDLANDVLGGGFLARLNSDLREEKAWSYGVYSGVPKPVGPRYFVLSAPVQADRTADSIRAIVTNMEGFPGTAPVTEEELQRVTDGAIRALPNSFETNAQVLGAIRMNQRLGRPDDYYETLAEIYRSTDADAIAAAASEYLRPDQLTYVIVGDREVVEPQLRELGMPIEIRETGENAQ
ncbi:zinc protease [Novosphingobium marinum]|uniref:Putative Zn-dependent peptidase n=1 Tax=Novosphingobium marinum TaxID=1514948 RepID=A0A7Z0BWJ2_9SPHN|nr:pitrilysin family protein [Novosphingobium marinum]NYH96455.1 putative Zn-dependent peptidase [Novosphingobium marinum]GGC35380.1 zinc protease [Novosphingobium marinum]